MHVINSKSSKTPQAHKQNESLLHNDYTYVLIPLTTNVPHHIETSQLISNANNLTGFNMMGEHCSLVG